MPRAVYTRSDLRVKDGLECLFWMEIAKRKARVCQGDAFASLLEIRQEVQNFLLESSSEMEDLCDDGDFVFLDCIQFGNHVLDRVKDPDHFSLIKATLKKHGRSAREAFGTLSYLKGFWLSDFITEIDLPQIHDWWSYIISGEGRNELGTKGNFSTLGEARPVIAKEEVLFHGDDQPTIREGDAVQTVISLQDPMHFPRRIRARQVRAYTTEDHNIKIDDHKLEDHIVLSFDLSKPLPSMREVELTLRLKHRAVNAHRQMLEFNKLIDAGILPEIEDEPNEFKPQELLDLNFDLPENHKLMVATKSARPLMAGLYCWDLTMKGFTDAKAAAKTSTDLRGLRGVEVIHPKQALTALKTNVRPLIFNYETNLLPWNS